MITRATPAIMRAAINSRSSSMVSAAVLGDSVIEMKRRVNIKGSKWMKDHVVQHIFELFH